MDSNVRLEKNEIYREILILFKKYNDVCKKYAGRNFNLSKEAGHF